MTQKARLVLSFSPNPVYRNHPSDTRWYFDALVQEMEGVGVTLQSLQAQWITGQGQVQDQLEEPVNISIGPHEQALFPELWVSSALSRFTYRLVLTGLDAAANPVTVRGDLSCW